MPERRKVRLLGPVQILPQDVVDLVHGAGKNGVDANFKAAVLELRVVLQSRHRRIALSSILPVVVAVVVVGVARLHGHGSFRRRGVVILDLPVRLDVLHLAVVEVEIAEPFVAPVAVDEGRDEVRRAVGRDDFQRIGDEKPVALVDAVHVRKGELELGLVVDPVQKRRSVRIFQLKVFTVNSDIPVQNVQSEGIFQFQIIRQ